MSTRLPAQLLAERDARIFALRKTGLEPTKIASQLEITVGQVNSAVERQLRKMNNTNFLAYPEVLRLELERLDALQASFWPKTQMRRVTLPDGETVTLEPEEKAADMVMKIMKMRADLLGMNTAAAAMAIQQAESIGDTPVRSSLAGTKKEIDDGSNIEEESRRMLQLAVEAGVVDKEIGEALLLGVDKDPDSDIVDAEIIEEET